MSYLYCFYLNSFPKNLSFFLTEIKSNIFFVPGIIIDAPKIPAS